MKENLQHTIKAFIRKGEKYYVAECLEIPVVTQGNTLDEVVGNLKEAVALHLEGEDLEQLVIIILPDEESFEMMQAAESSLKFWDNPIEDAIWNNA